MNSPPMPRLVARGFTIVLASALATTAGVAQQSAPCDSDRHRDFDFWVGEWTVTGPGDAVLGSNRIERISGGCALLENWDGARGSSGKSINFFDPATASWHQVWVGAGAILRLEGGLEEAGRMVLTGGPRESDGGTIVDRITWTLQSDGSVVQLWEISPVGQTAWQPAFRGVYRRTD